MPRPLRVITDNIYRTTTMATRCINSLNDLDKISQRIYRKHSKSRFRAGIEAKLKSARNKTEACLKEQLATEYENEKQPLNSCNLRNTSKKNQISDGSSGQCLGSYEVKKASCCANKVKNENQRNSKLSEHNTKNYRKLTKKKEGRNSIKTMPETRFKAKSAHSSDDTPRSVSVYGRHTQSTDDIEPSSSWFNFQPGLDAGEIDTSACEALNIKPLCYSVNIKESKSMPVLLKHQMQVRIGKNGLVKMENYEAAKQESCENKNMMKKFRKAPLSWDEQLNWNCVQIRTPRSSANSNIQEKVMCETRPVIFNEPLKPRQEVQAFLDSNGTKKSAFRFHREPLVVSVDPVTYTDSEKSVNVTFVGVEDVEYPEREENKVESKGEKNIVPGIKSDSEDNDKIDLSGEDIAKIYYSSVSDAKMDHKKPANYLTPRLSASVKKVSFIDEKRTRTKWHTTEGNFERSNLPNSGKSFVKSYSREKAIVGNRENGTSTRRPRTSSGIRREKHEEIPESTCKDDVAKRLRRPYTAPPSSPALIRDKEDFELFEKWLASVKERHVIRIPTSELENGFLSENESELVAKKDSFESIESANWIDETPQNPSSLRVSFTSKSAPPQRSPIKSPGHSPYLRCFSSQQSRSSPTLPMVLCSDASAELPKNLPPAQALIALRKKIRDELARQNQKLELDIQQLYLRNHPY